MNFTYKLGVIGFGNMAEAIVKGAINAGVIREKELLIFDRDTEKIKSCGFAQAKSNEDIAKKCEYILLAVKPQSAPEVLAEIQGFITENTIISIMAGLSILYIKSRLKHKLSVVRCMPNLPCSVKSGACGIAFADVSSENRAFALDLFSATGTVAEIQEEQINAVTCVSGSGPAYFYYFIQAMIEEGVQRGLSAETAKKLAVATCKGAAVMLEHTDDSIELMIDRVCSKGGTTVEAIRHFQESNLSGIVREGMEKCFLRAEELGK